MSPVACRSHDSLFSVSSPQVGRGDHRQLRVVRPLLRPNVGVVTGPAVPSGLEALLAEATPGPWEHRVWGAGRDEWPDNRVSVGRVSGHGEAVVINPRYGEREQDLANARLIALAPDAVRLLIDMAAHLAATRNWVIANMGNPDDMDALLARFAALDQRAGTA
jgi:hypothetical protein